MPQNSRIIGAKTTSFEVFVFDCAKQLEKQQGLGYDPDLRLRGHDKEGYGLSWSPFKEGHLLSGSMDHKICLWDVSAAAQEKVLDAIHIYEAHESLVNDVSWHLKNESLFGSVGDNCQLIIWDLRTNQAQQSVKAHERESSGGCPLLKLKSVSAADVSISQFSADQPAQRDNCTKHKCPLVKQLLLKFLVLLLGRLHHRNLVDLVGYTAERGQHMLLYLYMSNGNLASHLYGENHEPLSLKVRFWIALDVARALEYLHHGAAPPVVHRDIKSSNILLDQFMRGRVCYLLCSLFTGR